jgi:hypothetical protein
MPRLRHFPRISNALPALAVICFLGAFIGLIFLAIAASQYTNRPEFSLSDFFVMPRTHFDAGGADLKFILYFFWGGPLIWSSIVITIVFLVGGFLVLTYMRRTF